MDFKFFSQLIFDFNWMFESKNSLESPEHLILAECVRRAFIFEFVIFH